MSPKLGSTATRARRRTSTTRLVAVAAVFAAFLPGLVTADPGDVALGDAAALVGAPMLARLWTWWDRSGRWDVLDPLVIATAPVALPPWLGVIGRLVQLAALDQS
jgi:hypothetical protein